MIRVEMLRHSGRTQGFCVSGHAGYAEEGSDIVCSAVSALVTAAANGLTEIAKVPAEVTDDGNTLRCTVSPRTGAETHDAELIIGTLESALTEIRKSYRQYLKISDREV